MFLLKKIHS